MALEPKTLLDYLQIHAQCQPDALYARYLFPDRVPVEVNYRHIAARTRQFAAHYLQNGIGKDDVILIILPFHEDVLPAFFGAMWLGAIPALLPVPIDKLSQEQYESNLSILFQRTQPRALVTDADFRDTLDGLQTDHHSSLLSVVQSEVCNQPIEEQPVEDDAEHIAFIQYSSGSTGLQKGILLTHRAVLSQIAGVNAFFELTNRDHILSWIPLYHDWGLVGVALHTLQLGGQFTLISPMHWIVQPAIACQAIDTYRPTAYYQPNFAFNYMAMRVRDEEMAGLDLSSIRICCSGGEPCLHESHQRFSERFSPWGFNPASLSIVYGAAEVTCGVFAAGHREAIQADYIDRHLLQSTHQAHPVSVDDPKGMYVLGVGRALAGTTYTILDHHYNPLPEHWVGEIAIQSQARSSGYYRNPAATAAADHEGWYLTGDLGYRVGETLFVTGRKSDLIIVGGVNIYPQDVERIASAHPAVVTGRVVALGADDAVQGTQQLVVIAETRATVSDVQADFSRYMRRQVPRRLGVHVDRLYLAPYRWLRKTSSGKIARLPNYLRLHELKDRAELTEAT